MATDLRLMAHEGVRRALHRGPGRLSAMASRQPHALRAHLLSGAARRGPGAGPGDDRSNQWLERTLDDSANRRISIPEAFLAADAILSLAMNVLRGCRVYPEMMARHLADELPFLATENILMRAVSLGGDRQSCMRPSEYSVPRPGV